MRKNGFCVTLLFLLIFSFLPQLLFTQIPQKIPKKTKSPHKYLSRIYFLNGTFEDYHLLRVLDEQVEVWEYSKDVRLNRPLESRNFSTPTRKLYYLDIDRIVISRKDAFGHGFLWGGIIGGAIGITLGAIFASLPEVEAGETVPAFGALGAFSFGMVGGIISLGTKKRRVIRGDKDRFDKLKPYMVPFQHFE